LEYLVKRAAFALLGLLALPSTSSAEVITFTGVGKSEVVSIAGLGSVYAGELTWTGLDTNFYSYCIDLWNYVQPQQAVSILDNDPSTDRDNKAAWLFNTFASGIHTSSSGQARAMAAGLQLAIWETIADASLNLGAGAFTASWASTDALGFANQFLQALGGANYNGSTATLLDAAPGKGQDQIARVPEPTTLLLVGLGLLSTGSGLRRRFTRT
jgi:PEP-CTERM motif